jgi:hypothetical protein
MQHRRRADEDDQAEHRVLADHDDHQRDQGQQIAGKGGDRQVHDVTDAGDILADLGGDLGRAGFAEIADAKPHEVIDQPLLIAGDQIVADLRQRHGLAIGGCAPDDECRQHRAADEPDQIGILLGESLVDDGFHDPGHEGGGSRHEDQTEAAKI